MDRQVRYAQDGFVDAHQPVTAIPESEATGDAEVTVEPRPQDRPTVGLERDHSGSPGVGSVRPPERQVVAVAVAADDAEPGHPVTGGAPCDEGSAPDDVERSPRGHLPRRRCPFVAGDTRPRVALIEPGEAGRIQV